MIIVRVKVWRAIRKGFPSNHDRFSSEYAHLQPDLARTVVEILSTSNESSVLLKKIASEESVDFLIGQIFQDANVSGFRAGLMVLSQLLRTLAIQCHNGEAVGYEFMIFTFFRKVQMQIFYWWSRR